MASLDALETGTRMTSSKKSRKKAASTEEV